MGPIGSAAPDLRDRPARLHWMGGTRSLVPASELIAPVSQNIALMGQRRHRDTDKARPLSREVDPILRITLIIYASYLPSSRHWPVSHLTRTPCKQTRRRNSRQSGCRDASDGNKPASAPRIPVESLDTSDRMSIGWGISGLQREAPT